jgi:branched-chain amino acid transport system substrate-binding protein
MKKHGFWTMVNGLFLVVFTFALAFGAVAPLQAADPIKIGMVASITGPAGMMGSEQRDAVTALVEDINKKGGVLGRPLKVYIEDDRSQAMSAVIAATKLARDVKVVALIGPTIPDSGMAMLPIAEQEHVPFVVGAPIPGEFKKWVFHIGPSEESTAVAVLEIALNVTHAKRLALIYESDSYGGTGERVIARNISQYPGVSLVAKEAFDVTDADTAPQMTRIKAAQPEALIVYAGGAYAVAVARSYKQLGMKVPVVSGIGTQVPEFLKIAGPMIEDVPWVMSVWRMTLAEQLPPNDHFRATVYEPFKKIYQDRYGKDRTISPYHAALTDSINVVAAAIKLAGSDDRAAVRNALEKVRFEGLICPFACTPESHRASPKSSDFLVAARFKRGVFMPYKP